MTPRLCAVLLATLATPVWAGMNGAVSFQAIPTLDEIGLGALIALVAGVAGWVVKRRSRK